MIFFPGPGPFTLFAPDDAAFKKIPAATLNQLLKDKTKLQGKEVFFIKIQIKHKIHNYLIDMRTLSGVVVLRLQHSSFLRSFAIVMRKMRFVVHSGVFLK